MSERMIEPAETPELPEWAAMPADPLFERCEKLIDDLEPAFSAMANADSPTQYSYPPGSRIEDFASGIVPLYETVKACAATDIVGNRARAVTTIKRAAPFFDETAKQAADFTVDRQIYASAAFRGLEQFCHEKSAPTLNMLRSVPAEKADADTALLTHMLEAAEEAGGVPQLMEGMNLVSMVYSLRSSQLYIAVNIMNYLRQKPDLKETTWLARQQLDFIHFDMPLGELPSRINEMMSRAKLAVTQGVSFAQQNNLHYHCPQAKFIPPVQQRLPASKADVENYEIEAQKAEEEYVNESRLAYIASTESYQMSGTEIRKSPYVPLFAALVSSGVVFKGRQPDKQEARWIISSINHLADYAARGSNFAESALALRHAMQSEVAWETTHEARLSRLSDLKRHKYVLPLKQGLNARLAWLRTHREEILSLAQEHAPSLEGLMNRMNMLLGGQDAYADVPSIPLGPEGRPDLEEMVTAEAGKIMLRDFVEVAGELDWHMVPPEEIGPRDPLAGQKLVSRLRERYSRRQIEEQRILDFADLWRNFGGEVWENVMTEPGAALLFEHEEQPLILAEWFTRGKASYLLRHEADVSWRALLRLHRRDLIKRGGLQLIHPPLSEDGAYTRGDHQIAILEAAEALRQK